MVELNNKIIIITIITIISITLLMGVYELGGNNLCKRNEGVYLFNGECVIKSSIGYCVGSGVDPNIYVGKSINFNISLNT